MHVHVHVHTLCLLIFSGKIVSGFWSIATLLFITFYSSNLRQQIIIPRFDPDINSDADIIKHNVAAIHVGIPNEQLGHYYTHVMNGYSELYARVSVKIVILSLSKSDV